MTLPRSGPDGRRPRPDASAPLGTDTRAAALHRVRIAQSHQRCVALGVSRIDAPDFSRVSRADLAVALQRNHRLHSHAAPVMAMLHEQIRDTHSMVVLTDATGTVLHALGDDDILDRAGEVALQAGANWSEAAKGTNAIGTALVDEAPTLVHADEHFLHANAFLTCSAAPIMDARGSILGVLDVSGDCRGFHPHTLALVRLSARMIENRWLTDDFSHALRLHFHSRADFIGALVEGILAVDGDGRIVGANRGAMEQLGLSAVTLRRHTLASLFDTSVAALLDRFRSPLATPLPLHTVDDRVFMGLAHINWPLFSTVGAGAVPMVPPPATPVSPTPPRPQRSPAAAAASVPAALAGTAAPPAEGTLGDMEVALIQRTLHATGGNISEASTRLGISRSTIYRKLRWHAPCRR